MSVADPQPTAPKPKLRWFQYSLRTLLVVVTLFAIPCSWLAVKRQQARREREIATEIEKMGGTMILWSEPSAPAWLRRLLGDDFSSHVRRVVLLGGLKITDARLEHLEGLNYLQTLYLNAPQTTDAGLEHLKGLSQLQVLSLFNTKVTDAGLEYLKGLSQLQWLNLDYTHVTDAGLEHLKGLSQLKELYLGQTKVTDAGVKKLQQALPNCKIEWDPPTKDERQSPAAPDQLR